MYSNQFGKKYALVNIGHDELELDHEQKSFELHIQSIEV